MKFRPPGFTDWTNAKTPEEFSAQAEAYFLRVRDFYDSRARWHRRFYRVSGILIIVLGGALPLLASSSLGSKEILTSLIGFTVATVTALRGFYRWDSSWVLLRQTEIGLTREYLQWKGSTAVASRQGQADSAVDLLKNLLDIRQDEAKSFFRDLPIPQGGGQQEVTQRIVDAGDTGQPAAPAAPARPG